MFIRRYTNLIDINNNNYNNEIRVGISSLLNLYNSFLNFNKM